MAPTRRQFLSIIAGLLAPFPLAGQGAGDERRVRTAVQRFFSLLQRGRYSELYSLLPTSLRKQTTPDELEQSLRRLGQFIAIENLTIGQIQQQGDIAVVETVITGRMKREVPGRISGHPPSEKPSKPAAGRGRVTAQQYLIREDGQWRVATADSRSQQLFLRQHPGMSDHFELKRPRFEALPPPGQPIRGSAARRAPDAKP